ncbi:MAG: menaquinone biosynthesis protein [Candidatus Melainabacteria bacterium]|nr:menaquinone biosynthesis protein [Candidatus Melainabacteria bacterium]
MLQTSTDKQLVRIGSINFINCLPVNYKSADLFEDGFEFVESSPSDLNRMLRAGELDLAPISSYEYLLNKPLYTKVDGISISTKEQAQSVILFVKDGIEGLTQASEIFITDKSASSVNLLKIILVKTYGFKPEAGRIFNPSGKEVEFVCFDENNDQMPIKLLIGDEALLEKTHSTQIDLGTEWYQLTALPMVFGLWVINKQSALQQEKISEVLIAKKNKSLTEDYPDMIIEAYRQTGLSKQALQQYFAVLDYEFEQRHQRSLDLFESYLGELNLLC